MREAVTGPKTGTDLKTFPVVETTWKSWMREHPDTLVLSLNTGYARDYNWDPYGINAERAVGVISQGERKAYSFRELKKVKSFPIHDQVGNQAVFIYFESEAEKAWVTDPAGTTWNPSSPISRPGRVFTLTLRSSRPNRFLLPSSPRTFFKGVVKFL